MADFHWDIAIVGGGIAGSTLSCLLSRRGIRVGLIERGNFDQPRMGEVIPFRLFKWWHDRCGLDLFFDSQADFSHVGFHLLWGDQRSPTPDVSTLLDRPTHVRVDRIALDKCLFAHACEHGVQGLIGTQLRSAIFSDGHWQLSLAKDGDSFSAKADFAIEACGRSRYSPLSADRARLYEDAQMACVLRLPTPDAAFLSNRVWIESHEYGWWYVSALRGKECLIAFFTDRDLIPKQAGERTAILSKLWLDTAASRELFGQLPIDQCSNAVWSCHDARMSLRRQCFGAGWMAIGDAQMALDPLSGQGIAESLRSAETAADFLINHRVKQSFDWREWTEDIARRYHQFRWERLTQYQSEQRYSESLYWQRRLQPTSHQTIRSFSAS